MKAELIQNDRYELGEGDVAELVVWQVAEPVLGSKHSFKYRFGFIVDGVCVVRFDNERGKGDHFHVGSKEFAYAFSTLQQANVDFWTEVWKWQKKAGRH
jgi:Family of unknown function (DUF6516)